MYRTVADSIEAALRIAPLVRACRDEGERERRLPAQVLAAMHEARLFRMYIPKALDGLEIDPITSMIVVEEIARADAAAAWNLMLGATYGLWAAFLPEDAAREIYSASDAVVAGALRPTGRARPVEGGFVVDGRWSFASGIRHSAWWNAGCLVAGGGGDKDAPRPPAPEARLVFFPAADGKLIENWDVGGLRGTEPRLRGLRPVRAAGAGNPVRRGAARPGTAISPAAAGAARQHDGGAAARRCADCDRYARRDCGRRKAAGRRRNTPCRADDDPGRCGARRGSISLRPRASLRFSGAV